MKDILKKTLKFLGLQGPKPQLSLKTRILSTWMVLSHKSHIQTRVWPFGFVW